MIFDSAMLERDLLMIRRYDAAGACHMLPDYVAIVAMPITLPPCYA